MTDAPIATREAVQVDVRIQLGRHLAADGSVDRLISEAWTELTSVAPDGRRVELGRTHKQAVFTQPHADPEKRKVRVLHPSIGLGDLPSREIRAFEMDDLLRAPDGFVADDPVVERDAHVWSYEQSDPNRHVHAMEYVRVLQAFAADELARGGLSPRDVSFRRARALFRRPCFTGEWYRRGLTTFRKGDDVIVVGTIHALASADSVPAGRPATVVQLHAKKSLLSSSPCDKGP